jgi:hypothetical protein
MKWRKKFGYFILILRTRATAGRAGGGREPHFLSEPELFPLPPRVNHSP